MQVIQPSYDRSDLTVGIVHVGVGNFHRSHQAMYLDRLFNRGEALEWAICGVGLLPSDLRMRNVLERQDMRYTLVERSPDGTSVARSIASIAEYLYAPDDPAAVIERLADPHTKIVSLTITEGGYNLDDGTGMFVTDNPAVIKDLEGSAPPATVFGLVVEALRLRRERGIPPFTVMSCDNLPGNGDAARASFISFARLVHRELGDWIAENVSFPNCMVDRITPVTTDAERQFVTDEFGVVDGWPVVAEDFVQWVLEDEFTMGRPPLDKVGVQLVSDVAPYEKMKLRLLNAGHQAIAYFGSLLGYTYVHEAAADPQVVDFLLNYMRNEAESTLDTVSGIDVHDYQRKLIERFSNPSIRDTLARLATDASDRIPKFLLPVAQERIARGESAPLAAAVVASWADFARDAARSDSIHELADRRRGVVEAALRRQETDSVGFLRERAIFGDLANIVGFADDFAAAYRSLRENGPVVTLAALARDQPKT